jgi:hypothetical protein
MRVLNLGGGQQSVAIYLLSATGELPKIDHAIFADTGEEPSWVYETVKALGEFPGGAPIMVRCLRDDDGNQIRLGDNLIGGNNGRFASIPAFMKHLGQFVRGGRNAQGKGRRQCTREFKISVVETAIRREILGLKPGQAYRGERIIQVFGYDFDEGGRIIRNKAALAASPLSVGEYPLWDMQWRRSDCVAYVKEVWGREVLPSACTFCPLVSNSFRRLVRDRDPQGHNRACTIDIGLRHSKSRASQGLNAEIYVHRKMVPLTKVNLDELDGLFDFAQDCEGYCGN